MEENTEAAGGPRTITFNYSGLEGQITFHPDEAHAQLDTLDDELTRAEGEVAQFEAVMGALEGTVTSWDLEEGGQALPITKSVLSHLSYGLLVRLVNEIARSLGRHEYELGGNWG